jgi:hypothetical protein
MGREGENPAGDARTIGLLHRSRVSTRFYVCALRAVSERVLAVGARRRRPKRRYVVSLLPCPLLHLSFSPSRRGHQISAWDSTYWTRYPASTAYRGQYICISGGRVVLSTRRMKSSTIRIYHLPRPISSSIPRTVRGVAPSS